MVIKYSNLLLVALLVCFSLTDCEEEKAHPRDYPRVRTLPVSDITAEGATFNGDLYSLGTEPIKEYGFVWGPNIDPGLESDKVILPGANATSGIYTAEIRSALKEGTEYTVKSYVKTDSHVVYGTPLTFVSLGSLGPVIKGFSPDSAAWGDTLKIRGKNFSWSSSNNKVRLNQTECQVILSSDTLLEAIVKGILSDVKVRISVELSGNKTVFDKKDLFIKLPEITGFFPLKAKWHDTVTITGKNMIAGFNDYSVKIGGQACNIIKMINNNMKVIVSPELITAANEVKLIINDSELSAPYYLTLILPEIKAITPQGARWGDTIIISFTDLKTSVNRFTVKFGDLSGSFIRDTENTIKAVVPLNLEEINNQVNININNLELKAPKLFELLPPLILGISPKEGTWGNSLIIKGCFHPSAQKNYLEIGGYPAEIIKCSRDSMKVMIPASVGDHINPVVLQSGPFSVNSPESFILKGPVIESISPLAAPYGSRIYIRGKYFYSSYLYGNEVYFGSAQGWIISASDSLIICGVPFDITNDPVSITVKVRGQSTVSKDKFTKLTPVISRIYPLKGFYGDEITIEGQNLSIIGNQTRVFFRDHISYWIEREAEINSISSTKLVAVVPERIDSIPQEIVVLIEAGHGISNEQLFTLSPPEITGISTNEFIPGATITFYGMNFNPYYEDNQVFWGTHRIPVISSTKTQVTFTVPGSVSRGSYKLSLTTAGYKRTYPVIFEYSSKWKEVALSLSFNWTSCPGVYCGGYSFSSGNSGYLIDDSGNMMSYNPSTEEYLYLGEFNQLNSLTRRKVVVNRDTLYVTLGSSGISRFDFNSKKWITLIDEGYSDQLKGIAFSIDGKIYKGLDHHYYNGALDKNLWQFDPQNKSWLSKNDFPGYSGAMPVECFVIGNKGYVLFADKVFCRYDPETDTWIKLLSFPGAGEYRTQLTAFVIENKAYVGSGRNSLTAPGDVYDDFWIFNPENGSWSEGTKMPWGPRYNALSFVVNNKAYVGFGYKSMYKDNTLTDFPQWDFYEFDPYYPVK